MKRAALLFLVPALAFAQADMSLRDAQKTLADQGLYFGEPDGMDGAETTAAIRRYQIRKGLDVTGQLNKETRESLAGDGTPSNTGSGGTATVPPEIVREDREFLQSQTAPAPETTPRAPASSRQTTRTTEVETRRETGNSYAEIFRSSPYARAPRYVQVDTLRAAQAILRDWGYYRARVDGVPGPATRRAIIEAQEDLGYRVTGILDVPTLSRMELLRVRGGLGRPQYLHRDGSPYPREPRVSGSISIGFGNGYWY